MYSYPSLEQMTQDIINGAISRGIDPKMAINVAQAEGLKPGVWQSNYHYNSGVREKSYSPWQLNIDSPNALGSQFYKKTGLDPSDPTNWNAINNFALDTVKQNGWGDWYGAKRIGVTGKMGVGDTSSEPMRLGPSDENKMKAMMAPNQPTFPGLDPNNLVDPRKLTPIQIAELIAKGGGLMGPGSTPGLGDPNPQTLAAGQGDPSMFGPMAVANNAPMNPNQGTVPVPPVTPMAQAMKLGPEAGAGGIDGSGITDASRESSRDPNYLKKALLGVGAGLSSIDNPGGASIALGMMRDLQNNDWGIVSNKYGTYRYNKRTGEITPIAGMGGTEDEDWSKPMKKEAVKRLSEGQSAMGDIRTRLAKLDELNSYVDNPNVYQGFAGGAVAAIKNAAKSFGMDVGEGVNETQAFRALSNQFSLSIRNPKAGEGLPGNLSDKDLAFLRQSAPSLDNTPGGNKRIIAFMRKIEEKNLLMKQEEDKYISENHKIDGLAKHMDEFRNSVDVFSDQPGFGENKDNGSYMEYDPANW